MTRPAVLSPPEGENLYGLDTGREHVSVTMLSMFLNCPRRWDLYYRQRLELIEKRAPLRLGRVFQECIEHNEPDRALDLENWETAPVIDQARYDRLLTDASMVHCAASAYLRRWPAPAGEVREYPYRVRLRNPWTGYYSRTYDLLGFVDGLREHAYGWELIENKLVSQIGELSLKRLPLDRQLALMCYAVWRATGKPVAQVTYRFTRKPSIKQRKGEERDEFIDRLRADYDARLMDFYTHQETLFRSDKDLLDVECELWTWSQQMLEARKSEFAPRNSSHCHDFGGCEYIPICTADPDAAALYQLRPPKEGA